MEIEDVGGFDMIVKVEAAGTRLDDGAAALD